MIVWVSWVIFFFILELFRLQCTHLCAHTGHFDKIKYICLDTFDENVEICSLIVNISAVDRIASHHHHWKFHFTLCKWISRFIWMETVNVLWLFDESLQLPTITTNNKIAKQIRANTCWEWGNRLLNWYE